MIMICARVAYWTAHTVLQYDSILGLWAFLMLTSCYDVIIHKRTKCKADVRQLGTRIAAI